MDIFDIDFMGNRFEHNYFSVETNKTRPIQNIHPHYTNERFREAQFVYGKNERDLEWVYSDRLEQWDYTKSDEARKSASKTGATNNSALWFEKYLSAYFGKPVDLVGIMAGFNLATGYPYQVFGYRIV